jgi:aminoglycoside phosphotransferase (APT) family kinase protein
MNAEAPDFTGTTATPERLRFDEAALARYMNQHVEGFEGPLEVLKFKGGQSNPTYLLTTPAKRYVLRRKPPGDLLPSAHAVDREYRVMTALGPAGFPVPRTYAMCADESVIGTAFFIMDYVDGRIFWDASLPGLEPPERRALYDALVDTLAALHKIDPAAVGLADYGKAGNYFGRQIERWAKQYKAAETAPIAEMDRLIAYLPTAAPKDETVAIVHGDFRFDNVIMDKTAPRALAVLDWELSTLGHPLADFTYLLMVWRMPRSVRGGLAGLDLAPLGIPSIEEAAARYSRAVGRDVEHLDYCLAYNMFRLASIVQGVYARALKGNASSPEAAKMGENVRPLAMMAWDYAVRAGAV